MINAVRTENGPAELPNQPQFPELLSLSETEQDRLRERVAECQGAVRIFIHPYFEIHNLGLTSYIERPDYQVERKATAQFGFDKLVGSQSKDLPPIFIFEEAEYVEDMRGYLADILEESGSAQNKHIYLVPTVEGGAGPLPDATAEDGDWPRLIEMLRLLGVKKVTLGGAYLSVGSESQDRRPMYDREMRERFEKYLEQRRSKGAEKTDYVPQGCVGEAAVWISQDFEVEFSSFTFEHSRPEIRRAEKGRDPAAEDRKWREEL